MKSHFLHLAIALIIFMIALIGYGSWYAAISAKSAAVAGLKSQIVEKKQATGRIASARTALAEIAGDEADVQSYFVSETGVVSFINELEKRGQSQGTAVNVLSVSTGSTSEQPTLSLALSVKGTFNAVMRTVGAIEYMPYDLSIAGLSLAQDDKSNWHANLNLIVGSTKTATSTP